jgi:Domain of unknown function (DUF5047)
MRTVTGKFLASLRAPHLVASRCDVYFPGEAVPVELPVEAGQVTIDRTASVRRTGTVTVPWSLQAGADLGLDLRTLPLGGYAVPWRGIRYPDGTLELVQLGYLRVESVTWQTLEGAASLELADRMAQIRDEPFTSPYSPSAGVGITRTGTLANSPIVTGLASTTGLLPGMTVTGAGIPVDATILTVDSATQVTLTKPAVVSTTRHAVTVYGSQPPNVGFDLVEGSDGLAAGMTCYCFAVNVNGDMAEPWGPPPGTVVTAVESNAHITVAETAQPIDLIENGPHQFALTSTAQPLTFGGGKRIAEAAVEIVRQVFGPGLLCRVLYDPPIITSDVYFSENRADALAKLAEAAAAAAYFDADGAFVFNQAFDPDAPDVWTVDTGETGVLVDADESLDRTATFNGVLVEGQAAADTAPIAALVTDDDPTSPTRWGGPFGKVARIERNSAVQTVDQATAAAADLLERGLHLARSLTLTAAPNPALEAGDLVRVLFLDGRDERHIIDTVNIDLAAAGAQTLATRSAQTPAAGLLQPARRYGVHTAAQAWREARTARVPA